MGPREGHPQTLAGSASRVDRGSCGQGFLAPYLHIEGLELDQVPVERETGCQIPFHVPDLREGEWQEKAHTQTIMPTLPGQAPPGGEHTHIFISRQPCEEDT